MIYIKRTIIILSLILLYNCGFSSVYNNTKNNDLKLKFISMNGDNDFNNQMKTYAELYSTINSGNEYKIIVDSNFKKIIVTKNSSGVATNYKIIATANFTVKSNNKDMNFNFQETINTAHNSDLFKQNIYEKNLKRNFANSFIKKLIIKILGNSDNKNF
jgi:outer membrane lipopolysaccharide assembly protein LptE/RlpB